MGHKQNCWGPQFTEGNRHVLCPSLSPSPAQSLGEFKANPWDAGSAVRAWLAPRMYNLVQSSLTSYFVCQHTNTFTVWWGIASAIGPKCQPTPATGYLQTQECTTFNNYERYHPGWRLDINCHHCSLWMQLGFLNTIEINSIQAAQQHAGLLPKRKEPFKLTYITFLICTSDIS